MLFTLALTLSLILVQAEPAPPALTASQVESLVEDAIQNSTLTVNAAKNVADIVVREVLMTSMLVGSAAAMLALQPFHLQIISWALNADPAPPTLDQYLPADPFSFIWWLKYTGALGLSLSTFLGAGTLIPKLTYATVNRRSALFTQQLPQFNTDLEAEDYVRKLITQIGILFAEDIEILQVAEKAGGAAFGSSVVVKAFVRAHVIVDAMGKLAKSLAKRLPKDLKDNPYLIMGIKELAGNFAAQSNHQFLFKIEKNLQQYIIDIPKRKKFTKYKCSDLLRNFK